MKCPYCNSQRTKEVDTDFADDKPEGQPAAKKIDGFDITKYYCWDCGREWIEKKN